MISNRKLFFSHIAQTSEYPMVVEVDHAEGIYIYDINGKRYYDLDSGFSVSSLGHRHPSIIEAVKYQLEKYLHTSVYGEHIQSPQVKFAKLLTDNINNGLDTVYFTSGGSEAVEVAMKASRKYTERYEIISCSNAYHGSTFGAESLRSDISYTAAFMPGLPGIRHIKFNDKNDLQKITDKTAAVILEPIQAEAGIIPPEDNYLQAVRQRCDDCGALMVLDEIQTGFGRTGKLFAFQKYNVIPDIFLIAKAMGGGMPIGAMVTRNKISKCLASNPALGHINTFGGHPINAAAALANLSTLLNSDIIESIQQKEQLFKQLLIHPLILQVRSDGLFMAVELIEESYVEETVSRLLENGIITDFFLFNRKSFRIAPPLIISEEQIKDVCGIILSTLDYRSIV
jgi:acetylornithine/succinyldiaminopimelate/putrescine aminotransferase